MSLAVYLTNKLLKNADLDIKDRIVLTNTLIDKLQIPYKDIIKVEEDGRLTINDMNLDFESMKNLHEGAKHLLASKVRQLVRDQVMFRAVSLGVHKGNTNEEIYFSKAAIWNLQQEEELIKLLAQE